MINTLIFICFIIFLGWYYFKIKFSFWKNQGVPYVEPRIPYGNIQGRKRKFHSSQLFRQLYEQLKGQAQFGGIYFMTKPAILVTDLDFLKRVMIKDFQYFHDRGTYHNIQDDPLSGNLLNIEGETWKKLREKLSPTFSSGKMKVMLPTIVEVGERLEKFMMQKIDSKESELEIKEVLARFTTDIIGSCAFGIECNSLENSEAKFLKMGMKVFSNTNNSFAKRILTVTYPDLARKLHIKTTSDDVEEFFMKIVKDVVEYRETNKIKRNDFMDLLLQLKNDGILANDEKLTVEEIAAQAFVFFLATSSTTMTFCLHELSQNPDIQERVRENIEEVLEKYDGKITYEALNEMHYLEQCINESLRKFPPASLLIRSVTKDYQVPDTKLVLKKGSSVLISVYGIHHDPLIYPNPEKFDPDRFLPELVNKRHQMAFIPFGQGPRICIGERFGYLETKIGLVTLLSKFRFKPSEKTTLPLSFSKENIILSPEGGMFLKIEKI